MALPFSFSGWGTSAIAPKMVPMPETPLPRPGGTKPALPTGVKNVGGPGGGYNTVKPPMVRQAPVVTERVQSGGAVSPGGFSFSGWSSSRLVPKTVGAPIVQGTAGNIPSNAIPVGTGGPATGTNTGGNGVPQAITDAQSTLETFSNPTLLSFFSQLLNQNKGGGGGGGGAPMLSPTQEALNMQKLNLIGEPVNLQAQLREVQRRKAALGPAPFGSYQGSEQQRIADQEIDLMTRLGPASNVAAAAGGLAQPYSAVSNPSASSLVKNASGWLSSPWLQNTASTGVSRAFTPLGGMI